MFEALVISTYLVIVIFFILQVLARKKKRELNPLILPIIALAYHFIIDTSIKLSLVFVYDKDIDPIGIVEENLAFFLIFFGGMTVLFCLLGLITLLDSRKAKILSAAACLILLCVILNFNVSLTDEFLNYHLSGLYYYANGVFGRSPLIGPYFWSWLGHPIAVCLMVYIGVFNNESAKNFL